MYYISCEEHRVYGKDERNLFFEYEHWFKRTQGVVKVPHWLPRFGYDIVAIPV